MNFKKELIEGLKKMQWAKSIFPFGAAAMLLYAVGSVKGPITPIGGLAIIIVLIAALYFLNDGFKTLVRKI